MLRSLVVYDLPLPAFTVAHCYRPVSMGGLTCVTGFRCMDNTMPPLLRAFALIACAAPPFAFTARSIPYAATTPAAPCLPPLFHRTVPPFVCVGCVLCPGPPPTPLATAPHALPISARRRTFGSPSHLHRSFPVLFQPGQHSPSAPFAHAFPRRITRISSLAAAIPLPQQLFSAVWIRATP